MHYPTFHFRWSWQLQATPEQLWPYVADTDRFNRDVGLPAVSSSRRRLGANARRRLHFKRLGMRFEWEEEPFEWLRPARFSVRRRYLAGPIDAMTVRASLTPRDGGTLLTYETRIRPRTLLGLAGLPLAMGVFARRVFDRVFRRYDAAARAAPDGQAATAEVEYEPGGQRRLAALQEQLLAAGEDPGLVERLSDFIRTADASALARVRPYALADSWGVERRAVLELCLQATELGLFDMEWSVICPHCRGTVHAASQLAGLRDTARCETCDVHLATDLEASIELLLRVNPSIRPSRREVFCVAGPQVTPHVAAQFLMAAGVSREVHPALEAGQYHLRARGVAGLLRLAVSPDGPAAGSAVLTEQGWPAEPVQVAPSPLVRLENRSRTERLFKLERVSELDQAATAADVIRLQKFRDLFSSDLLRPGQQIGVGSITIAFTDLRDSTRIYRQIGDAPAFGRVLDHFQILQDEVSAEGGTVIKTIGDAIMAVFPRPINGIRALHKTQRRLAAATGQDPRFYLKAGLHEGSCIAVTLNDRLDYFGSVVNLASRLERYSSGDDVVVSDAVRQDPEVDEYIATHKDLTAEPFEANLKGFDEQEFRLWRLSPLE